MYAKVANEMLNRRIEADLKDVFKIIKKAIKHKQNFVKLYDRDRQLTHVERKLLRNQGYDVRYNFTTGVTVIDYSTIKED